MPYQISTIGSLGELAPAPSPASSREVLLRGAVAGALLAGGWMLMRSARTRVPGLVAGALGFGALVYFSRPAADRQATGFCRGDDCTPQPAT